MLNSKIIDGSGTSNAVKVQNESLLISNVGFPPFGTQQKTEFFQEFLTDSTGSNDMGINGSSVSVKFSIDSSEYDKYITSINFMVGYGSSSTLYNWVDSGEVLTNGFSFYYDLGFRKIYINESITMNSDLIRLGNSISSSWEIRNLIALNDYGYLSTIRFDNHIPPYGIKLEANSDQKIVFEVRDDNTDADLMNAIAFGFKRFE